VPRNNKATVVVRYNSPPIGVPIKTLPFPGIEMSTMGNGHDSGTGAEEDQRIEHFDGTNSMCESLKHSMIISQIGLTNSGLQAMLESSQYANKHDCV
jgi:hypothetical protein